jgi:hypothetical protein
LLFNVNKGPLGLLQQSICNITDINNLPGWQVTQTGLDIVPRCGSSEPSHVGEQITNVSNPPPPPPPPSDLASILQWGAQNPAIGHLIGQASGNGAWTVSVPGNSNWLSFGPYTTIATAGDYVAGWNSSIANTSPGIAWGLLDVNDATTQTQIAFAQPALSEWGTANVPRTLTVPFTVSPSRAGHQFEFRAYWIDQASTTEQVLGYVPLQWNAQDSALGHVIGRADANAPGSGWSCSVGDGQNWLQYGPYTQLTATGNYIALWTLRIDVVNAANNVVANIQINDATTQTLVSSMDIHRRDFKNPQTDQVFQFPFSVDASHAGHQFEFRIFYYNVAYLREQAVGVAKVQ